MTRSGFPVGLTTLLVLAGVAAGCGGGSTQTLRPGDEPAVVAVSDADSGRTVHATVGDRVAVTLHSTYWQLAAPAGPVLAASGSPTTEAGGPSCSPVPGTGCGTVRAAFNVVQTGTTRLEAARQSCGEAMRCTGSQGRWSVKIVATR